MGIKDNFSQAVKELWKKDGMEDNQDAPAPREAGPTQLDQYLAQQNLRMEADTATTAPVTPAQQAQTAETVQNTAPAQAASAAPATEHNAAGVPLETPYYRNPVDNTPQTNARPQATAPTQAASAAAPAQQAAPTQPAQSAQAAPMQSAQMPQGGGYGAQGGYNANNGFGGGYVPPATGNVNANRAAGVTDEVTVISKNTVIDGNVRSLANMQVDGNIKGNVETTRDIEMTGKVVGDIKCNNANMNSAAMQGNLSIKGKMRMDRDTILIGDLSSQYADVNGRIRGKLEIAGKAELKRDAIVFGDINASTIAVTDGAIIQGYVNTTFLSKEDSRNAFPDAISLESGKEAGVK